MQTFLPSESYSESAEILDLQRLLKQIIEAKQIVLANLAAPGKYGWQNHPATKMWRGHEVNLCIYGLICASTWSRRRKGGYRKHATSPWFSRMIDILLKHGWALDAPRWIGGQIHATHRSQLLRKNEEYYSKFGWDEFPGELEYYWPSKEE